ncbi:S1 RNA-binding domain-containing protein [Anaerosalibacter sp. Marseille-P3206]|uniref:S1 RNA-binding domain-containing protein n=1 Tax=Anaerosalibacter sp. Marseille-P3206 TaxID=1871005 RepID=UPI0009848CE5|nr:S1 RNA-binding domain-containing protein [Anaerosalibacter sp. Marseille-P3206]
MIKGYKEAVLKSKNIILKLKNLFKFKKSDENIRDEKFYARAKANRDILNAFVISAKVDEKLGIEVLNIDLGEFRGIIKKEDIDYKIDWEDIGRFVGFEVCFTVEDIDKENKTIYCSRKRAQKILEDDIIERLKNEEVFNATITCLMKYGAYVDIMGISAILKNSDFSDTHLKISDFFNIGDKIDVKFREINSNQKINVESVQKYNREYEIDLSKFNSGDIVLGVINSIKEWGVFVTITEGLDALCSNPQYMEISEGDKVVFKINQVKEEEERVRGKIMRIVEDKMY